MKPSTAVASTVSKAGVELEATRKPVSVAEMDQRRKLLDEKKQDQKDQGLLLKKKLDSQGFQTVQGLQARANPQNKKLQIGLDSHASAQLTDVQLYNQLFAYYERNNDIGFQSRFKLMMAKYPQSALADDSLYLAGQQQVAIKNYGMALKHFNRIIHEYPYSNKSVSALFAKGAVYRKMNLDSLAQDIFKKVIARYPSSPEAPRAQIELRLLK